MPGFIHSVNPKINAGVGVRPYTFAWLLGFAITSLIYVTLSMAFSPRETMIERAILPDEVYEGPGHENITIEGKAFGEDVEKSSGQGSWKEEDGLRVV